MSCGVVIVLAVVISWVCYSIVGVDFFASLSLEGRF